LTLQCLCLQSLSDEDEYLSSLGKYKRVSSTIVSSASSKG
jgi:hypothetical protein